MHAIPVLIQIRIAARAGNGTSHKPESIRKGPRQNRGPQTADKPLFVMARSGSDEAIQEGPPLMLLLDRHGCFAASR